MVKLIVLLFNKWLYKYGKRAEMLMLVNYLRNLVPQNPQNTSSSACGSAQPGQSNGFSPTPGSAATTRNSVAGTCLNNSIQEAASFVAVARSAKFLLSMI